LSAILKYPWMRETAGVHAKKWGAYHSEEKDFNFARHTSEKYEQSLEAALMDWADDIAYSVHDMEDFYLLGKIPLGRLSRDPDEKKSFLAYAMKKLGPLNSTQRKFYTEAAKFLFSNLPVSEAFHGEASYSLAIRAFGSQLINRFVLTTSIDKNGLKIQKTMRARVELMKLLVWHYVIDDESLALQQEGQKRIIQSLFEIFYAGEAKLFPAPLRERAKKAAPNTPERVRVVLDLISGLTEQEAVHLFHRLTGIRLGAYLSANSN